MGGCCGCWGSCHPPPCPGGCCGFQPGGFVDMSENSFNSLVLLHGQWTIVPDATRSCIGCHGKGSG